MALLQADVLSGRSFPYRRYGVDLKGYDDIYKAMDAADINWIPGVEKITRVMLGNGRVLSPGKGYKLTFRDMGDSIRPIAVVKSRYNVIDHTEKFAEFGDLLSSGEIELVSGGNYANRMLWLLARLKGWEDTIGTDKIGWHILAHNSTDGSSSFRIMFMPVRYYCLNGLFVLGANNKTFEYRYIHTSSADNFTAFSLTKAMQEFKGYQEVMERMQETRFRSKKIASEVYDRYVRNVMFDRNPNAQSSRRERIIDTIMQIADREAEHNKGDSLWGIYNSVVEYVDHVQASPRKGAKNIRNITLGRGAEIKKKAWIEAVKFLNN